MINNDLDLNERDKISKVFIGTSNVYLNDFNNVKKIYIGLSILLVILMGFIFNKIFLITLAIMLLVSMFLYMCRDYGFKYLYTFISNYESSYNENNLLLKRFVGKALNEQTYLAISKNNKTQKVDRMVEKRYWDALSREDIGSKRFNVMLENVIEDIETLQEISSLKEMVDDKERKI